MHGRRIIGGLSATAMSAVLVAAATAASAPSNPAFVIGDGSAGNPQVEFWGAQWWKDNAVSGGAAPASFKGWAVNVTPTGTCSGTFTTDPGNSSDPPATLAAGSDIVVLVTDDVTKSGDVISGDYTNMLLVDPNPGYQGDPGHPGTGAVSRRRAAAAGAAAPDRLRKQLAERGSAACREQQPRIGGHQADGWTMFALAVSDGAQDAGARRTSDLCAQCQSVTTKLACPTSSSWVANSGHGGGGWPGEGAGQYGPRCRKIVSV